MQIAYNKRKISFANKLSGFGGAFEVDVTEEQRKAIGDF